ncbi:MAG: DUF4450 domain-containing protein [Opitutaceae bacterium]|jgi:hypothetical protein|nr:DUF4450 domain-containing protein [Opitutaceae bacterium]
MTKSTLPFLRTATLAATLTATLAALLTALFATALATTLATTLAAQPIQPTDRFPNLRDNIERPLRYTPDGQDFVIENGGEFFNRPLYGGNTAFRVDAGDMPEFALYLPGRGGNLRLGIRTDGGLAKWLHETARITARYRPGEMLYEIRDPLLGEHAVLRVHAIALHQTEGLIVRVDAENLAPSPALELLAAYGGANGKRGKRDGDIGTESVPISEYFQLQPDACRDNRFTIDPANARFTLRSAAAKATLAGQFPATATFLALADASAWRDAGFRPASGSATLILTSATPVLISATPLVANTPLHFCIQCIKISDTQTDELADYKAVTAPRANLETRATADPAAGATFAAADLPQIFAASAQHFAALRNQITVDTPDAFINASVAALNVGADAVWDEPQGAVMHGAIAWRSRLLGWRGPYAMDALGWHARARRHLAYWATRQNTSPIPEKLPPPDENTNLSRSAKALHSNGDMANSHYDMNTVYIDALIRHILWTGDLDFARELWPVIERHLAWERRLFRREFGPDKLPLYEAYAQIWASDDLQYHGGGVTYATAYALYHNTQAARLARALGKPAEAAFHENEAALIARAAQKHLWLPGQGMYAEFRDLLGLQRAHPSAGLWSFYHAMDCGLITREQARPAVRYVNTHYPALPVRGPGVPADENYQVLSTTDWMPYTWSINNVVMGENIHAALALWQADRPDYAFRLAKSSLLASMFMGICPGNVGSLNYLDVYRRESQRDFADGSGVTTRAIVEGLFGIQPDALARTVTITPGWPAQWTRASIRHPDIALAFTRNRNANADANVNTNANANVNTDTYISANANVSTNADVNTDTYVITQNFPAPQTVRLRILPRGGIPRVTINGVAAPAPRQLMTLTGERLEIEVPAPNAASASAPAPASAKTEITVDWTNASGVPAAYVAYPDWSNPRGPDSAGCAGSSDSSTGILPVGSSSTGILPVGSDNNTTTPPTSSPHALPAHATSSTQFTQLTPPTQSATDTDTTATISPDEDKDRPLAAPINWSVVRPELSLWLGDQLPDAKNAKLTPVRLEPHFNDSVTRIFKNEYRSPRSPFVSLAIPKQGIGAWAGHINATADIDDSGLRRTVSQNAGRIHMPNGIFFITPPAPDTTTTTAAAITDITAAIADSAEPPRNILFTSLWDNYPAQADIPLEGRARHAYFLMAGSTNWMQSRIDNGELVVTYDDDTTARLALRNPDTWWPIEQDLFYDDYQFRCATPPPPRVNLKTGEVRILDANTIKGRGRAIPGGAATVLHLPLDPQKQLRSLTLRALSNEVVIGLMAVTLER